MIRRLLLILLCMPIAAGALAATVFIYGLPYWKDLAP